MFLTRMALDTNRPETQQALSSPEQMHHAVEQAADSPGQRCLWRFDRIGHKTYLLMVSCYRPAMLPLHERYGIAGAFPSWETRDYDDLLEQIIAGTVWSFRLCAGVEAFPGTEETMHRRFQRIALRTSDLQKAWLQAQAAPCGFACPAESLTVLGNGLLTLRSEHHQRGALYHQVWFDGLLRVTDEALLRRALLEGVGFGRSYGMGLITVMKPGGILHV